MKIRKFTELNEGLRVNTKTLILNGEYDIDVVINELQKLYDYDNEIPLVTQTGNGFQPSLFSVNLESELFYLMRDLKEWKKEGWGGVKGFGTEWIPISESDGEPKTITTSKLDGSRIINRKNELGSEN